MIENSEAFSFSKYTAAGNDYLVCRQSSLGRELFPVEVAQLCDRRFGVGADGILVYQDLIKGEPFGVRIFNSDGSECERSGNGLRIFSRWLIDSKLATREHFEIRCLAGVSKVDTTGAEIAIEMGKPVFSAEDMGLAETDLHCERFCIPSSAGKLDVTAVSLGNPHVVVFTNVPKNALDTLGPELVKHPLFMKGTNVQFVRAVEKSVVEIEVWERGSGRTLASGSSACAAGVAAWSRGLVERNISVRMPGGEIRVAIGEDGTVSQRGPVSEVYRGYSRKPRPIVERKKWISNHALTIREAVETDAPSMLEIYNHAVASRRSTCDLEPRPLESIHAWFDGRDFARRPIYVALSEGAVAGYLSVSNFWNDRPGYAVTADCGVYVGPAHQGAGVGSALLGHFLANAQKLGIHSVVTSMFSDNLPSVDLFRKFGFEHMGFCPNVACLDGQWKDLSIVGRRVQQ